MIRAYLEKLGYHPPNEENYTNIQLWRDWYGGFLENFHKYTINTGEKLGGVERYPLGMAKIVCEDHANLLLNEKVKINVDDAFQPVLDAVLEANDFRVQANNLIEISYALGMGAFVEYLNNRKELVIDFIPANVIYPVSWDNKRITACAFASEKVLNGKRAFYIQIHSPDATGKYIIENHYIDAEKGNPLPVPDGVQRVVATGSRVPLFQMVRPNVVNNLDFDTVMGVSVYGNAIPQLKAIDLVYDSYVNEFILGRKRVLVPSTMARIKMAADGTANPIFDPRDTIFNVYEVPSDQKQEMKEINMSIRAAEHEAGLNKNLSLISKKCGLGNERYKFDGGGVKTATEVVSEKSELFQNLKKNEIVLRQALTGMVRAIAFLLGRGENVEVNIAFDDSIIEDKAASIATHVTLTSAGLESKKRAIMAVLSCSEEEAEAEMQQIGKESMITAPIEDLLPGDEA